MEPRLTVLFGIYSLRLRTFWKRLQPKKAIESHTNHLVGAITDEIQTTPTAGVDCVGTIKANLQIGF